MSRPECAVCADFHSDPAETRSSITVTIDREGRPPVTFGLCDECADEGLNLLALERDARGESPLQEVTS